MPEQLLTILKICFLILLYLFFLRVLRAVWTELRTPDVAAAAPPGPAPAAVVAPAGPSAPPVRPAPPSPAVPRALVVDQPPEMAGTTWALAGDVTIGRSPDSSICIDDAFVSTNHARLVFRQVSWILEDLGSTNGTRVNDVAIDGAAVVSVGDRIGIGSFVLEAR